MSNSQDIAVALQQMQQQMQQMQLHHQQQIASLQQQIVASPHSIPAVVAASDKPRLLAPPAYDGRTVGGVDLWLRELRKQFAWYGIAMQGDAERIRFAAAHLTAVALDWWESLEQNAPTSWIQFEEQIKSRFHPANSADAARAALDGLRQQPKQLVHEYTAEFRRLLLAVPKMEEGDRVFRYVKGLQSRLAGLVRLQAPKTLADAISLAARVDGLAASEVSLSTGSSTGAPGGMANIAADGEVPMDVNSVEASGVSMGSVITLLQSIVAQQSLQQGELNAMRQEATKGRANR